MKLLAAGGAVAALALSVVIATAGGQSPQGRTLVFTEDLKQVTFAFVDNPPRTTFTDEGEPRRVSPGDSESFSVPVNDQQGKRAGRVDAHCVITRRVTARTHEEVCTAAFRLKDGVISAATAIIGETAKFSAAVTGGTGAYAGARGTLQSVTAKGKSTDTIELLP